MPEEAEAVLHDKEPLKKPAISMGASSMAGRKHPNGSEDAVFMDSDKKSPLRAFGVFDGMGGYEGGAVASSTGVRTVTERLNNGNIDPNLTIEQAEGLVKSLILEAHEEIKKEQKATGMTQMGSTATMGLVWEGKDGAKKLIVGNVGDSSMYIFRDGKLTKLTVDDDLGYAGRGNVLTQSLGHEDIEPRMGVFDLLPGDQIIAISDGVSDSMVGDLETEFAKALSENKGNPHLAAAALVNKSREFVAQGRKDDDQSAVVVEIEGKDNEKQLLPESPKTEQHNASYRLPNGSMVKVRRSDGKIDDDWFIAGVTEHGKIKLIKSDGTTTKTATPEELDSVNPPIEKASWDELIFAVNQLPDDIKGSNSVYKKEDIIDQIERIRNGEPALLKLTRAYGIRERVQELLNIDRTRKEINETKF